MSVDAVTASASHSDRYEAVLRMTEALSTCQDPEALATTLAGEIGKLLQFDHLCFAVVKESSKEIEYLVWGKGQIPLPDLAIEDWPLWETVRGLDPQHTADWNAEERFQQLKEWVNRTGLGSRICIPLATPHRRLGVFGIVRDTVNPFSDDEISFLRLIGRVVAFALDDGLNLRRSQHQNDQLQLLLNLTSRITSNLDFRELLHAIAASIREVMKCDAVMVSILQASSETAKILAMDFPDGKGLFKDGEILTIGGAAKRVLETLKPTIFNRFDPPDYAPENYERLVAEGFKSHGLIPLVNRGRLLGFLSVARTTVVPFSAEDLQFLTQAAGQIAIAIENALAYREISELKDKLAQEKLYLEEEIRNDMNFENIVGNSPTLKHVLKLVETVAPSDSTVLLLGETGTGKELIARAIHERSRRKDRTFVKLNCAAIPTGLLESELFGHEKGAFTGAIMQKIGRMELADQGTLFLDEVGDIPIEVQPKLLRALQERQFERLGSTHTRTVNIRLIAATNRDLEKMIAAREFRNDLYYRLHVFPIRIPPLRERKEDVPQLVSYFVQKFAKQMQKKIEAISPAVMKGLTAWEWPGNIRELENFIERAVILTHGRSLVAPLEELRKLDTDESGTAPQNSAQEDISRIVKETLNLLNGNNTARDERARRRREELVQVLRDTRGRVGGPDGAAARMGINRTTLYARLRKFGINPQQYS